jgi:hypothetical protein
MEETNFERTENDYCTKHREKLVDYCFDDHEALCHVCSHYEDHKSHKVKPLKEIMVEESSSEISMSTLIVDEGGKFNQTSLSNALKKASEKLVTKLLADK